MTLLKELFIEFDDYVNSCGCQQFATVFFDRGEDNKESKITIITGNGLVTQKYGHNIYNPSSRRHSVCTYVVDECNPKAIIKLCVIQHKGNTLFEVHTVSEDEYDYLFDGCPEVCQ